MRERFLVVLRAARDDMVSLSKPDLDYDSYRLT